MYVIYNKLNYRIFCKYYMHWIEKINKFVQKELHDII